MKAFTMTIFEPEIRAYYWKVEARNEEEAKEKALCGKGELVKESEFIGDIESIDREVVDIQEELNFEN